MDATLAQLLNHIYELEMEKAEILRLIQNPPTGTLPAGIDVPQEQHMSESE